MTTTARTATSQIATGTAALAELVIAGLFEDFDTCEICQLPVAELFTRIDNRDGAEIECCEHCADTADVSWIED